MMDAPPSPPATADLAVIAAAFPLPGPFQGGGPHGSGHINDTFAISVAAAGRRVRYILQRINRRVFGDIPALMRNIERVTAHIGRRPGDRAGRGALTLIKARDGRPWHRDAAGDWWRCYLFIEGARTHDVASTPRVATAAARAFGEFQVQLGDLPGPPLHETIPGFHHTRGRFDALRRMIEADAHNRAARARPEIAFALQREPMVDRLENLCRRGEIPERITHNDTKLNNVMIDERTGEAVCVIDLDTVMRGLAPNDFGDLVRSATNAAAEDERELATVGARPDIFEALVDGYLGATRGYLAPAEREHLVFAAQLMTYEVGLRFLADHLAGDVYFKTHRPGHNLDRARVQFALLRSLEQQQTALEAVVQRTAGL